MINGPEKRTDLTIVITVLCCVVTAYLFVSIARGHTIRALCRIGAEAQVYMAQCESWPSVGRTHLKFRDGEE